MILLLCLTILLCSLACFAYVTNPFSRWTVVRLPYRARLHGSDLVVDSLVDRVCVSQGLVWRGLAYVKCGLYILETRYVRSPRSHATTVPGIIADIHTLRYNPDNLLVISGDHFTGLFVRNLGVFYYPLLDSSIPSSLDDWKHRQLVYLQSVTYALAVFDEQTSLTTTIVPTGAYRATCINFYAYPSDTLYGMLYALAALRGLEAARPAGYRQRSSRQLYARHEAARLTERYRATLRQHYQRYKATVYDTKRGLIRTDIHLSGAKDITRRQSAFYDNVIFWKTTELAMQLQLIPKDQRFLRQLKQRILRAFWLEEQGYFLEDLSAAAREQHYYSSDWLIVLATGFLSPRKKQERPYFMRSVSYIQAHGIDKPFPLKYQHETRASRQFLPVRLAVASYGGDAIWSFWGMEYIKLLLLLYKTTNDDTYLKRADRHIKSYKATMRRDGGFPEVYDAEGVLLQTPFYRSIRQTGWVIGFEQVLALRQTIQ